MRFAFALLLCFGCNTEKQRELSSCDDVDDLQPGTPLDTFMTLNGGLKCNFSGSCMYGQTQLICEEPSSFKQVRCNCNEGTFECQDTKQEVDARNAVCSV